MILGCLKLAAAEGVQQDFIYSNLLLKAFKMCGKGHRVLLQWFGRKQGHGPEPFSSGRAATELASSTKLPHRIPAKPPEMWQNHFSQKLAWVGGEEAGPRVSGHHSLAQPPGFPTTQGQGQVSPSARRAPQEGFLRGTPVSGWTRAGPMRKIADHVVTYGYT